MREINKKYNSITSFKKKAFYVKKNPNFMI